MFYRICRFFSRVVFRLFYRWRVLGTEHLPARGGCIIVANHRSNADPIVLGAAVVTRITRFMAKEEIFSWPVLGSLARWLHAFPVRRGAVDRRAVKTALTLVKEGHVLALFPEGSRFKDGELHEFKNGAARIHLATRAPLIPVGLAGTERIKPFCLPRLAVMIGPSFSIPSLDDLPEREALAAINAAIRAEIETCVAGAEDLKSGRRKDAE